MVAVFVIPLEPLCHLVAVIFLETLGYRRGCTLVPAARLDGRGSVDLRLPMEGEPFDHPHVRHRQLLLPLPRLFGAFGEHVVRARGRHDDQGVVNVDGFGP